MKVRQFAKARIHMFRPAQRRHLARPSLAEEIAIARGIMVDPDTRVLSRSEMRQMRPFF